MNGFLDDNFLLGNETARMLYHDYASEMPIIDYHNHLSPEDITTDRSFDNITEAWLAGDHYKWRAMRANGIGEEFITGPESPESKFRKWAETVPYTLRNPLYHWTHLELRRYFGIFDLLNPSTASTIYTATSEMLRTAEFSSKNLLKKMNVQIICTTDDPTDNLEYHRKLNDPHLSMYPAFRPDRLFNITSTSEFNEYIGRLEQCCGQHISSFEELLSVMENRIAYFHENGCRISDHGLEQLYPMDFSAAEVRKIFIRARSGDDVSMHDQQVFVMALLFELCKMYHQKGWIQQFHLGALRNNNARMLKRIGRDTGFDSIGDFKQASGLSRFLGALDLEESLTKTIIYNLNPADNAVFATMAGNFNDGSTPGKIQYGAAWWFLDQKHGIEQQLDDLSNMGLLSRFVGMLTDSRSLLSFPRHEYFRRILCDKLGMEMEVGELPSDPKLIGEMIRKICYFNARDYFNFPDKSLPQ